MVWSEYIPLPLVLPPEAGPNDNRVVIDSSGISIFIGATLVVQLGLLDIIPDPGLKVTSNNVSLFVQVDNTAIPALPTIIFDDEVGPGQSRLRLLTNPTHYTSVLSLVDAARSAHLDLIVDSTGLYGVGSLNSNDGVAFGTVYLETVAGPTKQAQTSHIIKLRDPSDATGSSGNTMVLETWHNLPLSNLWVADLTTPQYRMMIDGTVLLQGNMKNGTTAAGTVIGTLPVGYRPLQVQRYITAEQQLGTGFRHISVQTNGNILVFNCTAAFIGIDGVRFPVI